MNKQVIVGVGIISVLLIVLVVKSRAKSSNDDGSQSGPPYTITAGQSYKICGCRHGKWGVAYATDLCSNQHVTSAFASGFKCMWTINGKNQFLASTSPLGSTGCMPVNKDPGYTSNATCSTTEAGKSIVIVALIISALLLVLKAHGEY